MSAIAFFGGLLFGLGLIVSGMADPSVVLGFFNIDRDWNPSLAFVMVGAVAAAAFGFAWARRQRQTMLGFPMLLPVVIKIDRRLIGGSLIFGIGWGLAGICPGPAIVLVGSGNEGGFIFAAAMLFGMWLFRATDRG